MKKIVFLLIILITTAYLFLNLKKSEAEGNSMKLMSSAFNSGGVLPITYTCDGKNINPPLQWTDAPAGTKSFMLIMEDPDAPGAKEPWVHWVVFNIPPSIKEIKENADLRALKAVHGLNNRSESKFYGACPPDKMHRYYFRLYALDTMLTLLEGASKGELMRAIEGHILAKAELMATYERN